MFSQQRDTWTKNKWPESYLETDHYGSKLLIDNNIFGLVKFYKHEFKYDEEDGLLILQKKSKSTPAVYAKWNEIYPYLAIKKTTPGTYLFEDASYTEEGFKQERHFLFSATEFKSQLNTWLERGWPIQYLLRDHFGAKVLFDNQVFQYMEFYGHSYQWDEKEGILLLYQKTLEEEPKYAPFQQILEDIPLQSTPQGWHLFDGYIYGQNGLSPIHLWEWKTLPPSYIFPKNNKPNLCYVDIVTFNWEHDGLPGLGFIGRHPHGHTSIEFGDDEGHFYSIGMYMDPRSPIDPKKEPGATIRACLMSPDTYLPSKGEKTVHRYSLGTGVQGRNKIKQLKDYIDSIQSWSKNPDTGLVKTCPRKYHVFKYNCGDFQEEIEVFTANKLGGKLVKIEEDSVLVPGRKKVPFKSNLVKDTVTSMWNRFLLFLVDVLIFILVKLILFLTVC